MPFVTNYGNQTDVNTINCYDYMLRLNIAIKQNLVVLYVVPGLSSSEVFWGFRIISSQIFLRAGYRLKLV